jgi:hypothetical protein
MSEKVMPISKWIMILTLPILVASCSKQDDRKMVKSEEKAAMQAEDDGKIECALAGADKFMRVCETERIAGPDGQILVIRHPDGGFRRFKVLTDGRGLVPSEGADLTKITVLDSGTIELLSGDDLYHLPAQVKQPAPIEPATKAEPKKADVKVPG